MLKVNFARKNSFYRYKVDYQLYLTNSQLIIRTSKDKPELSILLQQIIQHSYIRKIQKSLPSYTKETISPSTVDLHFLMNWAYMSSVDTSRTVSFFYKKLHYIFGPLRHNNHLHQFSHKLWPITNYKK